MITCFSGFRGFTFLLHLFSVVKATNSAGSCNVFESVLMASIITEWLRPRSYNIVVASYSGLYEEGDVEHIKLFFCPSQL